MSRHANLDNIAVVLQKPRFPENIGAAARAMRNMGMKRLIVVNPRDCDLTRVLRLATHEAFDVVEEMRVFDNLKEALSPFNYVVGTTARLGGERKVVHSPYNAAREVIPISAENRVALLFGPEDKGLSNLDIRKCHILVNIPTADFSSLNLAQAVMVMCYEIQVATREKPRPFTPRLASRRELDGMFEQLKDILVRIDYINPENPDYWMNKLRHFCTRLRFRAREVSIIRGICRQINWYSGKCFEDGVNSAKRGKLRNEN